jgi:hypothetical protein
MEVKSKGFRAKKIDKKTEEFKKCSIQKTREF